MMHDQDGRPDPSHVERLLNATSPSDILAIPLPGPRKWVSPASAWSCNLLGPINGAIAPQRPLPIYSDARAKQLVELFGMGLLRDVPFTKYKDDPVAIMVANDLDLDDVSKLFRTFPNETGHPVSQLLYRPFSNGFAQCDAKYPHYPEGQTFLKTEEEFVTIFNGGNVPPPASRVEPKRYCLNLADLASLVERDEPASIYTCMCDVFRGWKVPTFQGNPDRGTTFSSFVDFGITDIQSVLSFATLVSLHAAWYHKWRYCVLRPEEYAFLQHIQDTKDNPSETNFPTWIYDTPTVQETIRQNGSILLPQSYSEGCPTHPAFPAGHATIAACCCTILKAFYDTVQFELDEYVPTDDGSSLVKTGNKVRLVDEIDKLASNVAIGRNAAGVHWRDDNAMEYGEAIAIQVLKDHCQQYWNDVSFTIQKFNGDTIQITRDRYRT